MPTVLPENIDQKEDRSIRLKGGKKRRQKASFPKRREEKESFVHSPITQFPGQFHHIGPPPPWVLSPSNVHSRTFIVCGKKSKKKTKNGPATRLGCGESPRHHQPVHVQAGLQHRHRRHGQAGRRQQRGYHWTRWSGGRLLILHCKAKRERQQKQDRCEGIHRRRVQVGR